MLKPLDFPSSKCALEADHELNDALPAMEKAAASRIRACVHVSPRPRQLWTVWTRQGRTNTAKTCRTNSFLLVSISWNVSTCFTS